MPETDRIDKISHAEVKGELVGNSVPPDGIRMRTRGTGLDEPDPGTPVDPLTVDIRDNGCVGFGIIPNGC